MQLITQLLAEREATDSYFQRHLIGEDLRRLAQAEASAPGCATPDDLIKAALMIGWTPGDTRTHELRSALEPMLAALWTAVQAPDADADQRLLEAWRTFEQLRIDRLVGCLARVPAPE